MVKDPQKYEKYVRSFGGRRYFVEFSTHLRQWKCWFVETCPITGQRLQRAVSGLAVFSHEEFLRVVEHVDDEIRYQSELARNRFAKPPTRWSRIGKREKVLL